MIHRVTLVAGAFVATAVMAFAAGAQSVPPPAAAADPVATQEVVAAVPVAAPVATPAPTAQTKTDTVYVLPAPEPAVVHVTKQAPPTFVKVPRAHTTTTTTTRHRSDDGEREGGESEGGESEGEGD
jgi:hypothetical protein